MQGILYLLGYTREEINIDKTNKLNWKKVKNMFASEEFYKRLNDYKFE